MLWAEIFDKLGSEAGVEEKAQKHEEVVLGLRLEAHFLGQEGPSVHVHED